MADTPIIVKKKKQEAHAHHGGSWKVAYADFVTAMMAFFMVMWIMGMDAETRSMVQGYFNDPLGFVKNPPKSQSPFTLPGSPAPKPGQAKRHGPDVMESETFALKQLEAQISESLKGDDRLQELATHVELKITPEGLQIEFIEAAGDVFFETGRDIIRPKAMELIRTVGPILAQSNRTLVIEGHTDAAQYAGLNYTNLELSTDRASALRKALSSSGVALDQFQEVRGFADTKLRVPEDPLHYSNRRVTVLLPFAADADWAKPLPKTQLKAGLEAKFRDPVSLAPNLRDKVTEGRLP
ncbi:MAG: OmpA family protein [Armatimonadetes bacterium]|uniref:Chemotaxis protein MotB n=1 Tax=Candidatus Nitrosymbiomonas proteolyticus TaxID=2608984 RepID=A0A809R523_9BACT|nr:MAG: chemotaxis protein MotB [Armatimonadota bacterium]MCZ7579977.1 OmpA family protein [Fimbriimonadaceae bacterium]BBO22693.1 chemotaxis protein MotB [Candidatus Nitrosymbiomonas proteolyticus]MBL1151898.1 chemotaxis protein MotB [Armatimonadota bacterium]NOG38556.1 OmpA family protein [Armatimonadota bacterium]